MTVPGDAGPDVTRGATVRVAVAGDPARERETRP